MLLPHLFRNDDKWCSKHLFVSVTWNSAYSTDKYTDAYAIAFFGIAKECFCAQKNFPLHSLDLTEAVKGRTTGCCFTRIYVWCCVKIINRVFTHVVFPFPIYLECESKLWIEIVLSIHLLYGDGVSASRGYGICHAFQSGIIRLHTHTHTHPRTKIGVLSTVTRDYTFCHNNNESK